MPRRIAILAAWSVAIALLAGCDFGLPGIPTGPSKPVGGDLATATPVTFDATGRVEISGTITSDNAVHVYDLGSCEHGDRIIISVDPAAGSGLDPTTAVFDENGQLFALNDDKDIIGGLFGSAIDEVVTVAGSHFYLAITKFYQDTTGGAYEAIVRIERGVGVTTRPVQVLLLNFAGGEVTILGEGTISFGVFDAADIDAAYAGKTAQIKAKIAEVVRENYAETGVHVVTTDEPAPTSSDVSTIHFGAFSRTKFGVAQSVDQGNRDLCDDGIVFTDDFDKPFASQPSADGVATAIANVAAHEAGHLLGLNHVSDVTALMDTTGTASTLLADQEFKTAPLHPTVFPIGEQNSPAILQRVVPK